MELDVTIQNLEIDVVCNISTQRQAYSFALAKSLPILEITDGGQSAVYDEAPVRLPFRPEMVQYTIKNIKDGTIRLRYHGALSGIFGYMREHLIHFSFYNGWFPVEYDAEHTCTVKIHRNEQWELIHGTYDPAEQCWHYTVSEADQKANDCNILLLNKAYYRFMENDAARIFYLPQYEKQIQDCFSAYDSICRYYVSLYGENKIGRADIVFLCVKEQLGAYYRDGLIVFSAVPEELSGIQHGLAHEAGHAYGCGASTESWEDWLNETTAEWLALIYESELEPDAFDENIRLCQEQMSGNRLCLREAGDARPDNVHLVGTLVYYEIYQQYGAEAIKTLLRTFNALEQKNTAAFLDALKKDGADVLAEMIARHL